MDCIICHKKIIGMGNNASPVKKGICCDNCNIMVVIPIRIRLIQKQHENTLIPKKKPRGGFLTDEDKAMNKLISSIRIGVEHAIGGMKRFRAVSEIFRNKNGWDDLLVTVSAGLWNFHIQMT